jgi:hypothetical protein
VLQSEHGLVGFELTVVPRWLQHKIHIFNKCDFFQNIFLKENFLKEKEESFGISWNIPFGNGILEIN